MHKTVVRCIVLFTLIALIFGCAVSPTKPAYMFNLPSAPEAWQKAESMAKYKWLVIEAWPSSLNFYTPAPIMSAFETIPFTIVKQLHFRMMNLAENSIWMEELFVVNIGHRNYGTWSLIQEGDIIELKLINPLIGQRNVANYLEPVFIKHKKMFENSS